MAETFLNGRVTLHCGDCIEVLAAMPEASVDSVVTDPPYHLTSGNVSQDWSAYKTQKGTTNPSGRGHKTGFMGKAWDGGDVAFRPQTWAAVRRVLKPGAHLLAFGGTRTYHRLACAIEDGGFEVRDAVMWHYGNGFPKSLDVSKAIDKAAGAEREVVRRKYSADGRSRASEPSAGRCARNLFDGGINGHERDFETRPATEAARQWQGWGTALKPATEIICLARKPFAGTIAANVLAHGTGALNIDRCRVATGDATARKNNVAFGLMHEGRKQRGGHPFEGGGSPLGRWPANLVHDGSDEVVGLFPEVARGTISRRQTAKIGSPSLGDFAGTGNKVGHDDPAGSAARFFYCAKAGAGDRVGSRHPTVKPVALLRWLVRLVTPPGGTVLDPFAGTGTTAEAAWLEGFSAVLIEREAEYQADIRRRMGLVLAGPDEKTRAISKAKGKSKDFGPLFDEAAE